MSNRKRETKDVKRETKEKSLRVPALWDEAI